MKSNENMVKKTGGADTKKQKLMKSSKKDGLLLFRVSLLVSSCFRSSLVKDARFGNDGASEAEGSATGLLQNAQNVAVASSGAPQCGQWRA
jgi:hypothetical protein